MRDETESIRLWWVTNWQEGKQIIESLPFKPNISTKLWKSIAFGSYVNLQEFSYKNLLITMKEAEDDPVLQSTEGGSISIKKRPRHTAFSDISEWLLAFKSYMDAVLVIYENREQELNGYRDHINELCLRQSFHAVMAYDKNCRVTAVTNHNSTLLDRDTEVEGRNFDVTTVKRQRLNTHRSSKLDTEWPDMSNGALGETVRKSTTHLTADQEERVHRNNELPMQFTVPSKR
ncbi:hypothetical protein C2G38_2253785 [Gigaspora rosea]|uniref:Uncharacterized protein n=1 Tax=Gigaspora rosea TaxID=44941 RepID=A0A397U8T4_9GLOM|nr:hypothetical protein C2G38_2253785 [Gigaspora rosea]